MIHTRNGRIQVASPGDGMGRDSVTLCASVLVFLSLASRGVSATEREDVMLVKLLCALILSPSLACRPVGGACSVLGTRWGWRGRAAAVIGQSCRRI
ncbi:hypothetical protein BC834DRAFT_374828 [Gloeopeniophorella convolvens]|nr:hypothetical protein BC834DRAFT_374828 [Gloeopeniophorella convolvens]